MATIGFALFLFVLLFAPDGAAAATSAKYIRDDSNGGDCASIGAWDKSTKTCTLNTDLAFSGSNGIVIANNGLNLNGNGHTLTGTTGSPWRAGVTVDGKSNVTVKNLTIKQFNFGIRLNGSSGITLRGNATSANFTGISLRNSAGNTIIGNTASSNSQGGITLDGSTGNTVEDNTASSNSPAGIYLYGGSTGNALTGNATSSNSSEGITIDQDSPGNALIGNTTSYNPWYGFYLASDNNTLSGNTAFNSYYGIMLLTASGNTLTGNTVSANSWGIILIDYNNVYPNSNKIYRNNFLNNYRQADVFSGLDNRFNLAAPIGGNYWSDYDLPDEGCSDTDSDGFCDLPHAFRGGQDGLPRTAPVNCGKPRLAVVSKALRWGSYMDFLNRTLTASYQIKNSSSAIASSVKVTGSVSSNGVGLLTQLPLHLPDMPSEGIAAFELKYQIPLTVTGFHTITTVEAMDGCQNHFKYDYEYDEAVPLPQ